jgi:hypothetical protein
MQCDRCGERLIEMGWQVEAPELTLKLLIGLHRRLHLAVSH